MLQVDGGLEVIGRLFTANEGFRGQIRDDQMAQCINEVRGSIAASLSGQAIGSRLAK